MFFGAAIAVRQVFACVLAGRDIPSTRRDRIALDAVGARDPVAQGPQRFDVPDKLWLLGLGHLGQAYVWNLCLLPGNAERLAVLQDDQPIGEENEATSLLVLPGGEQMGESKTRVACTWLEACGWAPS